MLNKCNNMPITDFIPKHILSSAGIEFFKDTGQSQVPYSAVHGFQHPPNDRTYLPFLGGNKY